MTSIWQVWWRVFVVVAYKFPIAVASEAKITTFATKKKTQTFCKQPKLEFSLRSSWSSSWSLVISLFSRYESLKHDLAWNSGCNILYQRSWKKLFHKKQLQI